MHYDVFAKDEVAAHQEGEETGDAELYNNHLTNRGVVVVRCRPTTMLLESQ